MSARFVHAEQVSAHVQIRRMNGDVLRREALFDDALQFVFGDRRKRCIVAVKKERRMSSSRMKSEGRAVSGLPLQKQKGIRWRTDAGRSAQSSSRNLPLRRALYPTPNLRRTPCELRARVLFRRPSGNENQIVAHDAPVDFNDAVASLEIKLCGEALRRDFRD
jgi:hypothetical protein